MRCLRLTCCAGSCVVICLRGEGVSLYSCSCSPLLSPSFLVSCSPQLMFSISFVCVTLFCPSNTIAHLSTPAHVLDPLLPRLSMLSLFHLPLSSLYLLSLILQYSDGTNCGGIRGPPLLSLHFKRKQHCLSPPEVHKWREGPKGGDGGGKKSFEGTASFH